MKGVETTLGTAKGLKWGEAKIGHWCSGKGSQIQVLKQGNSRLGELNPYC